MPLESIPEFTDLLHSGIGLTSRSVPPSTETNLENLRIDAYQRVQELSIGSCLDRAWNLFKSNPWPFIGAFLINLIATFLLGVVSGLIPCIGSLIQIAIGPVLQAGLFWYFLLRVRGQPAEFSDLFEGFQRNLVQIVIGGFLISVLTMLAIMITGMPFFFSAIASFFKGGFNPNTFNPAHLDPSLFLGLPIILGVFLVMAVIVILSVMWFFSMPLMIDKELSFWDAMELSRTTSFKNFLGLLGLLALSGVIGIAGFLLCCIGAVFTVPLAVIMIMYAYEDIFGNTQVTTAA